MPKVKEIILEIEKVAPTYLAEGWDNPGLQTGSMEQEVHKVLLALDADEEVAREAVQIGADLVLTHHPLIFRAIKSVTDATSQGRSLLLLASKGIALYSAHTNLDSAKGGLNDEMAERLGLCEITMPAQSEIQMCRVGSLPQKLSFHAFVMQVKSKLALKQVMVVGDFNKSISKVSVCTGSGSDLICEELAGISDVFVTGELKYAAIKEAHALGLCLIGAGHYETEIVVTQLFLKIIEQYAPNVEIVISKENKNPCQYL